MSACTTITTTSPIVVTANIKRWTITSDDIYLLRFSEEPEPWLNDLITNVIEDTGLADDVGDLTTRFDNFEEGYTAHFYDWRDGDTDTLAYVETIYTSNSVFNAGIQEIKVAYVSKDESGAYFDSLIGAWQTGAGGAWFNQQVSVVSNVAYAAAKSASTLTASMASQYDDMQVIAGDLETLSNQIDGVIETWFYENTAGNIGPNLTGTDNIDISSEPYATWLSSNELAQHTGDGYVLYELDASSNKIVLNSWQFGRVSVIDEPTSDSSGYFWKRNVDPAINDIYQKIATAQTTADGKINSYYQTTPPVLSEPASDNEGDLWTDSDDNNKLYRYDGTEPYSSSGWILVRDTDITASVDRLDEATVDINGIATAKSSLVVNADGNISGYVASASTDPNYEGSSFRIFADKFVLAATDGQPAAEAPFTVDTVTREINFNGVVEFSNINGGDNIVTQTTLNTDLARTTTIIDGGRITTGYIDAQYIKANSIWVNGLITSSDYTGANTGYVGLSNPSGFMLNGSASAGSYNYPNIYGSYIRGGYIYGTTMEAVTMKASDFLLITDAGYTTGANHIKSFPPIAADWLGFTSNCYTGISAYNSSTGSFRFTKYSNNQILVTGKSFGQYVQIVTKTGFGGSLSVIIYRGSTTIASKSFVQGTASTISLSGWDFKWDDTTDEANTYSLYIGSHNTPYASGEGEIRIRIVGAGVFHGFAFHAVNL